MASKKGMKKMALVFMTAAVVFIFSSEASACEVVGYNIETEYEGHVPEGGGHVTLSPQKSLTVTLRNNAGGGRFRQDFKYSVTTASGRTIAGSLSGKERIDNGGTLSFEISVKNSDLPIQSVTCTCW